MLMIKFIGKSFTMKKLTSFITIALFSMATLHFCSCTKDNPKISRDISGNYNVNIHYHDNWFVSNAPNQHGTDDTVYNSVVKLSQVSEDTLKALYFNTNGETRERKLYLNNSNADSLVYALPYGHDYDNVHLTFYPNNNTLKMKVVIRTNPSGGGHNITYLITSL